ncbi:hypothetical protein [Bacteriovorax stolpii]|uniref:hypothetical protein n=1 Tax=Bacteriovorax stolpii TaxID=960 RepID=UPI001FD40D6A|nr:hypothetical protein [Bacteriovorax stolpii]
MSTKSVTEISSEAEINNIFRRVISEISDEAVCSTTNNFLGKNPNNTAQTALYTATGTAFLQENGNYGLTGTGASTTSQGQIQVTDIRTVANGVNEMILKVSFQRKGAGLLTFTTPTVTKELPLNTILDASGNITSCFGNFDQIAKNAVNLACQGNAAKYDAPTAANPYGTCTHNNLDITNTAAGCPDGQYIKAVTTSSGRTEYTCASLNHACPTGQFVTGYDNAGNVKCGYALKPCAAGSVLLKNSAGAYTCTAVDCTIYGIFYAFAGFNANGGIICREIGFQRNCGANNFSRQVNANGDVDCNAMALNARTCPEGQRITGVDSAGTPTCAAFINLPASCNAGEAMRGIDANGNPICDRVYRLMRCNGTGSSHNDKHCTDAGGYVANMGGSNSMCVFNGSSCPSGWARCSQWGYQYTTSCTDISNTYYCDANRQTRYAVPYGGSGNWQDQPQNSTTCYSWNGYPNTSHACYASAYTSVTTNQTQVGCY